MTNLTQTDLLQLVEHEGQPCVSMFLPTHAGGRDQRQDPIRLKNLRNEAFVALTERGLRRPDADAILAPLDDVLVQTQSERRRGDSLACFLAEGFFQAYSVGLELSERLVVGNRFYVKPLVPLVQANGRYYVLLLTKDDARLFEATRDSLHELRLPEIRRAEPDGLETHLQHHAHRSPSQGRGATTETMFHGHGGADDRAKVETLNFFHRVDDALQTVLPAERTPLVLACVGYLAPIYAQANSYPNLLPSHVSGGSELAQLDVLREQAWRVVQPSFRAEQDQALQRWASLRGNELASCEVEQVVLAAATGRVEDLFVKPDAEVWGSVDLANRSVHRAESSDAASSELADDTELLDYAVAQCLAHGGNVYSVSEIPDADSPLAATLRY